MTNLVQQIVNHASKAFSKNMENFTEESYQSLISCLNRLKASDLNLNQTQIDYFTRTKRSCGYTNVFSNKNFSLSIFSVIDDFKIPLHDHHKMKGIIKVLSGKIKIKSYNFLPENKFSPPDDILKYFPLNFDKKKFIPVQRNPDLILSSESESELGFLTQENANIHEISVASDCENGASFLDVLSPPYSDKEGRSCFYYKIIHEQKNTNLVWLVKIPSPSNYNCISFEYTGKKI